MPRQSEQVRRARESAKIRARRAQRVTYDLPPALRRRIQELAASEKLPASQLVTLALLRFLRDYASGAATLEPYRQPSRSPRYAWNLVYPPDLLALAGETQNEPRKQKELRTQEKTRLPEKPRKKV